MHSRLNACLFNLRQQFHRRKDLERRWF